MNAPISKTPDRTFRCSFTLPADLATELNYVARSLGVSQSALVSHILEHPLGKLAMRCSIALPIDVTDQPGRRTLRLRGESAAVIEKLLSEAVADAIIDNHNGNGLL